MALLSFMAVAERLITALKRRTMGTEAEAMDTSARAKDTSVRVMDTRAAIDILALI